MVYGANPPGVLDLAPTPRIGRCNPKAEEMAEHLRAIHEHVRENIQKSNEEYKTRADGRRRDVLFEVGEYVWVVLPRDHFPLGEYNKLKDRKIGPCEVLAKINDNAYKLRLPSHLKTSVFNVKHLSPYVENDGNLNSRPSSSQLGETDAGASTTFEDVGQLSDSTLTTLE